ncbi:MAG: hypothetical protein BJG00_002385 [Limnothrix sp. CACIAM 69d]|jgi:hypothetical protein|nr:MAG: hypothetical protein BJG00_002385 [Limnothrix sp. CACIAM 69d]
MHLDKKSSDEIREVIIEAIDVLKFRNENPFRDEKSGVDQLIPYLYQPKQELSGYLDELKVFLETEKPAKIEKQQAGYLLEKILLLAFMGLEGYSEIKSYQSASHQHDLLISGENTNKAWKTVCEALCLRDSQKNQFYRGILCEAKAIEGSVSVNTFSRLCHIINMEFQDTVGLGVFFTIKGATGFPKRGDTRNRCVRDARLCQIIHYARSGKKVIVLDKDDIFELNQSGALIKILIRKIKEIEELTGLPTTSIDNVIDVDLPEHLKDLYND